MPLRFLPTAGSYTLQTCLTYSLGVGAPCLTRNIRDPRGSPWVVFSGADFSNPHPLPEAVKGFFLGAPEGLPGAPKGLSGAEKDPPRTWEGCLGAP